MSAVIVDSDTFDEINNVVEELLNEPSDAVTELVKKLDGLLRPYNKTSEKPRQKSFSRKKEDSSKSLPSYSRRHKLTLKKISPRHFNKAQSALFSTTTTATGLPKEEPEPEKTKRLQKILKEKSPLNTPADLRNGHSTCEWSFTFKTAERRRTCPSLPHLSSSSDYVNGDVSSEVPTCPSPWSQSFPDPVITGHPRLDSTQFSIISGDHEPSNVPVSAVSFGYHSASTLAQEDSLASNWSSNEVSEGRTLFRNYEEELLTSVFDWNFQIFDLAAKTDNVLSQMAFKLFESTGLFETFRIPKREFVVFMTALERGYQSIPYHNKIHAADVLHGCWFLTTQEVPGFGYHYPHCSSDPSVFGSDAGNACLAQAIPALELMSLYLAAAMHDFDHPGKTNAFLVETRHRLAKIYNDRSVLENYHASASWQLLYSNPDFDFLKNLETAEWKRLRFLIVEAILATDLKKHFEILSQFSTKARLSAQSPSLLEELVDNNEKSGLDWSDDQHRLLVCQMVIKLADISGPAKARPLHITWTKAICEEFFLQGDEERKLSMSVSPFMDREKPQVAELQRTFINNLITPVLLSMHRTGILAGEIPVDNDFYADEKLPREQNLLIEHLKSNLRFWKATKFRNGQEEMTESFKYALPHKFSCSSQVERRNLLPSPKHRLLNGCNDEHDDDVFVKIPGATLPNGVKTLSRNCNGQCLMHVTEHLKKSNKTLKQQDMINDADVLRSSHCLDSHYHKATQEQALASR